RRPELVRSVVAHEPPLAQLLPERDAALQVIRGIHQTYQESGLGPAMARFIAVSTHQGEVPADLFEDGGPDPAMFGLPTEDEGRRDDALLGQNLVPCTSYQPDLEALRAARRAAGRLPRRPRRLPGRRVRPDGRARRVRGAPARGADGRSLSDAP